MDGDRHDPLAASRAAGHADPGVAGFSHLILIYHFHIGSREDLTVTPFLDRQTRGVFATRSPARPNRLGLSIVRLIGIEGCTLTIEDVDIVDGTPLLDIKPYVYCSLIGTCLSDGELRRLVPRFMQIDPRSASELDVHHAAVDMVGAGGPGCKAINKALDERYAAAIRRFGAVRTEDGLRDLWRECLAAGDVPGAYWVVLTHPDVTPNLRQLVFGEVHMLSHLVGASNRADIRRLVALETENAALKGKVARQQRRLKELSVDRGRAHEELRTRWIDEQARRVPALADEVTSDRVRALRDKLVEREQRLLKQQSHALAMDDRAAAAEREADRLRSELERAQESLAGVRTENEALERALSGRMVPCDDEPPAGAGVLRGRKIVYVGGRPSTHQAIRQVVEVADGRITIHDGGLEDRKGLLDAAIARADFVAFPVDCIDHDSAQRLKRQCERLGVAWYPLRTASVGSFVALIERLAQERRSATSTQ